METRQLAYFVLACHVSDQAQAASLAGITQSTLSESLSGLEAETGLQLFRRGPRGRYPTEAARWMCQIAEHMLQLIESVSAIEEIADFDRIDVLSPLHLMLGRLYRAANAAARELRATHRVLARVQFHSPLEPAPDGEGKHINLNYSDNSNYDPQMFLFDDDWVAVCPSELGGGDTPIDVNLLRTLPLLLPPMMETLERQGRQYCARLNLGDPTQVEEDLGIFSRLSRQSRPFALLAPRSLVAGGLQRGTLTALPLATPLRSSVVADISAAGTAGPTYVNALQRILAKHQTAPRYETSLSLRQLRYFLTAATSGSISAAARKLNVVQPALSGQLHKLEAQLGKAVFKRSPRGIEATQSGSRLLHLAREIVGSHDRILRDSRAINAAERHHISVGIDPMAGCAAATADAVAQWLDIYPDARINFVEGPYSELSRLLEAGEISFFIAVTSGRTTPRIALAPPQVLRLVLHKANLAIASGCSDLKALLSDLPLVLPPEDHPLRRALESEARRANVTLNIVAETTSAALATRLIARINGAAVASLAFATASVSNDLAFVPLGEDAPLVQPSVLFSAQRGLRDSERMLVRLLEKTVRSEWSDDDNAKDASHPHRTAAR